MNGTCTAFAAKNLGSCTGIDITAPTTCVPSTAGFRVLTVCNRGTVTAPAGVKCYRYPGGSPKYPNPDPGIGTLVMTTASSIAPGDCETQEIAEGVFGQNGIQSIACNPLETSTVTVSEGPYYPATNTVVLGSFALTAAANAYASDSNFAIATPANPNGTTTLAASPTTSTTYQADATWTNPSYAYSASPANQYATVAPAMPAANMGTIGPSYPTTYSNPASTGDTAAAAPTASALRTVST